MNNLVNVNTASERDLQRLPGIGPVLAVVIVRSRRCEGLFESVEDLERIWGLGFRKLIELKEHILFEEPASQLVIEDGIRTSVWRRNESMEDFVEVSSVSTEAMALAMDVAELVEDIANLREGVSAVRNRFEAIGRKPEKPHQPRPRIIGEILDTDDQGRVVQEREPDMEDPVAFAMYGVKTEGVSNRLQRLPRSLTHWVEQQRNHVGHGKAWRQRDIAEHNPAIVPWIMWKWLEGSKSRDERRWRELLFWSREYTLCCEGREDYVAGIGHVLSLNTLDSRIAWCRWMSLLHTEKFEGSLLQGTAVLQDEVLTEDEIEEKRRQDLCMTEDQVQEAFGARKRHGEGYEACGVLSKARKHDALIQRVFEFSSAASTPIYGRFEMTDEDWADCRRLKAWRLLFGDEQPPWDLGIVDGGDEAMTMTSVIGTPYGGGHEGLLKIVGYEPRNAEVELKSWRNEQEVKASRQKAKAAFCAAFDRAKTKASKLGIVNRIKEMKDLDVAWSESLKKAKEWWNTLSHAEMLEWACIAGLVTVEDVERNLDRLDWLGDAARYHNHRGVPYGFYSKLWKLAKVKDPDDLKTDAERAKNKAALKAVHILFDQAREAGLNLDAFRAAYKAVRSCKGLRGWIWSLGVSCKDLSFHGLTPVCHYMTSIRTGHVPTFAASDYAEMRKHMSSKKGKVAASSGRKFEYGPRQRSCSCYTPGCSCNDPSRYSVSVTGVFDLEHDIRSLTLALAQAKSSAELLEELGAAFAKKAKAARQERESLANRLWVMTEKQSRSATIAVSRDFPSIQLV